MSLTKAGALQYEDMPLKINKRSVTKIAKDEKTKKLQNISVADFAWAKVKQHKFGVLMTFTVIYVAFTMFGTLIVGLVQSFVH